MYGRGETSVVESRGHRIYCKQRNRTFPACGIFPRCAEKLLEESRLRQGCFHDSSNGSFGESLNVQLFPQIMNVIKEKVGLPIFWRLAQP